MLNYLVELWLHCGMIAQFVANSCPKSGRRPLYEEPNDRIDSIGLVETSKT